MTREPQQPFKPPKKPVIDVTGVHGHLRGRALLEMIESFGAPTDNNPLQWTFDNYSVVFFGFGFRPEDERPCTTAVPCGVWGYEPNFLEPVSAHPIRGDDVIGTAGFANKEVCAYHWGMGVVVGHDGFMRVAMATTPSKRLEEARNINGQPYIPSVGGFVVLPPDNPYNLPAGFIYGLCAATEPPWVAVLFHGDVVVCRDEL